MFIAVYILNVKGGAHSQWIDMWGSGPPGLVDVISIHSLFISQLGY